jgi:hypothetical protein
LELGKSKPWVILAVGIMFLVLQRWLSQKYGIECATPFGHTRSALLGVRKPAAALQSTRRAGGPLRQGRMLSEGPL